MNEETVDAILSARRLVLEYKRKNGGLRAPVQITSVNKPSGWSDSRISYGLKDAAEAIVDKTIEIAYYSASENGNFVPALLCHLQDRKIVFVSDNNNFCWRRFYACKELCHAVMTEHESLRTRTGTECFRLISDLKSPSLPSEKVYPAYLVEDAAYFGAIEMLLPPEFWDDIYSLAGKGISTYDIALKYSVPKIVIEHIITKSTIIDVIDNIRRENRYLSLRLT